MPAKKKTPPSESTPPADADMLDAPAFEVSETETPAVSYSLPAMPPTQWPWPESKERRALIVPFNDHDRSELAKKIAQIQKNKEDIEEEAKLTAKAFKQRIEALESEISYVAESIRNDGENRNVECQWLYEVSGIDESGNWIVNPEYKVAIRLDSGEIVASQRITEEERQQVLPLDETSDEDREKFIREAGWTLAYDENPAPGFNPFYLTPVEGTADDIDLPNVDNRSAALKAAVEKLRTILAGTAPENPENPENVTPNCHQEGYEARTNNLPRARCPYPAGSPEAQTWKEGWDAKDAEVEGEGSGQ